MSVKSFISVAAAATLLAATPPAARAANLIVNGSFETPIVPVGSFTNFPVGSTAITGWTVVGVDSAVISTNFVQSGIAFRAQQGNQFLDTAGITANSPSSGVSQNVPTAIGARYTLRFFVGSATDNSLFYPSTVDLRIAGGPRVSYTNPIAPTNQLNWMQFAVTFTATSTSTNLTFLNGSAANNFESLIDNVTLEAAPACTPSDVAGPGQSLGSDGQLTADDIIVFLNWFFAGDLRADVAGPGQATAPDTQFTADDIIVFLNRFFAGC